MTYKELRKEYPWHFWVWIISSIIGLVLGVLRLIVFNTLDYIFIELRVVYMLIFFFLVYISGTIIKDVLSSNKIANTKIFTSIEQNLDFWDERNYIEMSINALNGLEFLEQLFDNKRMVVKRLLLIVPDNNSINSYYKGDTIVSDKTKSKKLVQNSIKDARYRLEKAVEDRLIISFEVKEISRFPIQFYAVVDNKKCIVGNYLKNDFRKETVGIKSISWAIFDKNIIREFKEHFDNLWNAI